MHLPEFVVDWVWLPIHGHSPFVSGTALGGGSISSPIGDLGPSGLTSLRATQVSKSSSEIAAFKKVVAPAQAIIDVGTFEVAPASGWS